jgi:polyhydroxybutyrate depolymerase
MDIHFRTILLISLLSVAVTRLTYSQYDSLLIDGLYRTFLLHLPSGYTGVEPLPLMVAMHGGFGSAINLQNQSGLSIKADQEHFIVVYPEGLRGGLLNIRTWNAGWCCGASSDQKIDDVGFVDTLLDILTARYAIDPNRIYATGMSNGGFMAYRLACELSHRIAAIAPVACSMSMTSCSPERPVPVIHFHSYLDSSVPYQGGIGDGVSNHYNPPLDSVGKVWAGKNHCQNMAETLTDNDQYTQIQWTQCDCQSEINHYLTRDGGHSWPGGQQTIIGDPVSQFIDANDLMWAFFQKHALECSTTAINLSENTIPGIYPNPSTGIFHLSQAGNRDFPFRIYHTTGQEITATIHGNTIDLSHAEPGIYFLHILMADQVRTIQLIKTAP